MFETALDVAGWFISHFESALFLAISKYSEFVQFLTNLMQFTATQHLASKCRIFFCSLELALWRCHLCWLIKPLQRLIRRKMQKCGSIDILLKNLLKVSRFRWTIIYNKLNRWLYTIVFENCLENSLDNVLDTYLFKL